MRIPLYYISLIDKDNPDDPIRKMAIPSEKELNISGSYDTIQVENEKIQKCQVCNINILKLP